MIRILVVDDHPAIGEGTKQLLENEHHYAVTYVPSGSEALALMKKEIFDVFLFDLYMPDINGLELSKKVIHLNSEAIILIYSGFDIAPHFNMLIEAGVSGFISKTASKKQLMRVIDCALNGDVLVPLSLLKQLRRLEPAMADEGGEANEWITLMDKELEILTAVAKGKSNKEIAECVHLSQRGVEYHLTRIFTKLKVKSRIEAVEKARKNGLLASDTEIS